MTPTEIGLALYLFIGPLGILITFATMGRQLWRELRSALGRGKTGLFAGGS